MTKKKKFDKYTSAQLIEDFFERLGDKPDEYDIQELVTIIEAIIPVHATLEMADQDEIDNLLAIYPFLYQKLSRVYAYFCQMVRIAAGIKDKTYANKMRNYKDAMEQLLKAIKLQYDSLSRRITIYIDRR